MFLTRPSSALRLDSLEYDMRRCICATVTLVVGRLFGLPDSMVSFFACSYYVAPVPIYLAQKMVLVKCLSFDTQPRRYDARSAFRSVDVPEFVSCPLTTLLPTCISRVLMYANIKSSNELQYHVDSCCVAMIVRGTAKLSHAPVMASASIATSATRAAVVGSTVLGAPKIRLNA